MHRFALIVGLLFAAFATVAADYDRGDAVEISQAAIGRHVGEHHLRDIDGQAFDLSRLQGKPLVISMIYTSCHHVCPLITKNLADTVDVAQEALGEDAFSVVTIGFDWKVDTPDRMRQYAVQQGVDLPNWYFLAADATAVNALSETLGFQFFVSTKGFDHLAQTTIVDSDGTIYRQVYGVDINTQSLVEPLKELVFDTPRRAGLIEHWLDTFKLFCTVYDPNSDRYRFDYSIFMTIFVGILSLGALAVFIVREWRRAR
ncbi:MAG: SCO family protein [Gammaproteobacteria bacterium]|nr:SCO family protein [Gammaproteobacteria bacterium]